MCSYDHGWYNAGTIKLIDDHDAGRVQNMICLLLLLQYIGCLDVNTSMKNLDFETRSLIAK